MPKLRLISRQALIERDLPANSVKPRLAEEYCYSSDQNWLEAYTQAKCSYGIPHRDDRTPSDHFNVAQAYGVLNRNLSGVVRHFMGCFQGKVIHCSLLEARFIYALNRSGKSDEELLQYCWENKLFNMDSDKSWFDDCIGKKFSFNQDYRSVSGGYRLSAHVDEDGYLHKLGLNAQSKVPVIGKLRKNIKESSNTKVLRHLTGCHDPCCALQAVENKTYSESFSDSIFNHVCALYQEGARRIHYVIFASGGMRKDIERLQKIKEAMPDLEIDLSIFDPLYKDYLDHQVEKTENMSEMMGYHFVENMLNDLQAWYGYYFPNGCLTVGASLGDFDNHLKSRTDINVLVGEDYFKDGDHCPSDYARWYATEGASKGLRVLVQHLHPKSGKAFEMTWSGSLWQRGIKEGVIDMRYIAKDDQQNIQETPLSINKL